MTRARPTRRRAVSRRTHSRPTRRTAASRSARALLACLPFAAPAGCIDFVEPDLPAVGAPVVLQASVVIQEDARADVNARLAPGFDADGFGRTLSDEALRVNDVAIEPDSVLRNGTRVYDTQVAIARAPAEPVVIIAPAVDDVAAEPPAVRWFTLRRAGPAAITLPAGADLVLVLDTARGIPSPVPAARQWVLGLTGASTFTIAASGSPPDTIIVPARWIPAPRDGAVRARLIEQQSAQLQPPPGDYIGVITLDARIEWTVVVGAPARPAALAPREE